MASVKMNDLTIDCDEADEIAFFLKKNQSLSRKNCDTI